MEPLNAPQPQRQEQARIDRWDDTAASSHWPQISHVETLQWHGVDLDQRDIANSVIFSDTAAGLWSDLKDRFSQGNDSRIYEIQQEIAECRQGSQSVSVHYTKLKALWDELASYQELIVCSCEGAKTLSNREEKERVMQFLMGLNES